MSLVLRSLSHYWRTNVAVVLGVATAVSVLAGALLVGDSVRGSLRDLVVQRLGRTDLAIASTRFFRERLAEDLAAHPTFTARFTVISPLIAVQGTAVAQAGGLRAGRVRVYGVDDRFWRFHGVAEVRGPDDRDTFISQALADEIAAAPGDTILVRVQRPSAIPLETLFSHKDDVGRTVRLTVRSVLPRARLGEFSLQPQQGPVRAVFVPLARLQQELDLAGRVNALLASAAPAGDRLVELQGLVRTEARLEDIGLTLRAPARGADPSGGAAVDAGAPFVILESNAGLLDDREATTAMAALAEAGAQARPVFTYLANTLRAGDREVPYSLVTAMDLRSIAPAVGSSTGESPPPIVLNEWAARDLDVTTGAAITLEYYRWEDPGRLVTRTAGFRLAAIVPIAAGDPDLAPRYPGITDAPALADWDPPFPIDLRRIRPADDTYWDEHGTTPKAFIPLETGQSLWKSRYGGVTSLRIDATPADLQAAIRRYEDLVRARIDPLEQGIAVRDVRGESLAASRGATDFGEYFVYFSAFLVVSALLLAALFFKLGIEQRAREVGLLRAVGFRPASVRRLFMTEGLLLSGAGSALGVVGAIAYAAVMMAGLRTWWSGAVGTTALALHVSAASLAIGALSGVAAATACIWWTLRSLAAVSERRLLAGHLAEDPAGAAPEWSGSRRLLGAAGGIAIAAAGVTAGAVAGLIDPAVAFFGAGAALLAASLCLFGAALRMPGRKVLAGRGSWPVVRLGLRGSSYRPGRSVLSMAVMASATFILVSVDAFRHEDRVAAGDPRSGTGGYGLLVETLLPIARDPNTPDGRDGLNLRDRDPAIAFEPFRVRPGDDASCLNLYEPRDPRILAPRDAFLAEGRFAFQASLASTEAERLNPWLLLQRDEPDGAVPVIADANSLTYVLRRRLGDDLVVTGSGGPARLRIVAALRDSIFQGELLMSEAHFLRLFPEHEGYRFLLVETPVEDAAFVAARIEDALRDLGADARLTADRLAEFHEVENTYLSTFQTLGGLGLLLGTVGLGTVLLRNALERRRELALLGAIGYRRSHFLLMIAAENAVLLAGGLGAGIAGALLAIGPALADRGGRAPLTAGALVLLFGIVVTGLLSSVIATRAAVRAPLLHTLRSE